MPIETSYLDPPDDLPYERAVGLLNPTKESSDLAQQTLDELRRWSSRVTVDLLYTNADPARTMETLQTHLQPDDLLIVMGGDGTLNTAVSGIMELDTDNRPPVLVAPLGTANDFSRSLNGKFSSASGLTKVLSEGNPVTIHPLVIKYDALTGGVEQYYAVNNAGFHYTAQAADLLNQSAHRHRRLGQASQLGKIASEMVTVSKSMQDLTTFKLVELPGESYYEMSDRTIVHASHAMKYGRFAINHTDMEFLDIPNFQASRTSLLLSGLRSVLKASHAIRTELVWFRPLQEIKGHVDGETFDIPALSTVTVNLAPDSFQAISRNLS